MPSINLAPGSQYIIAAQKRRVRLYSIAAIIVVFFTLAWGALYSYENVVAKKDAALQQKIQDANVQIQALRTDAVRVALFEKRLGEIKQLLDSHIHWNGVFAEIERLLPGDTVMTNIEAVSDAPTMNIQAVTSQLDSISIAIASLTNSGASGLFQSASVKNIQRQEQRNGDRVSVVYSYTIVLAFDPKVLWQ